MEGMEKRFIYLYEDIPLSETTHALSITGRRPYWVPEGTGELSTAQFYRLHQMAKNMDPDEPIIFRPAAE